MIREKLCDFRKWYCDREDKKDLKAKIYSDYIIFGKDYMEKGREIYREIEEKHRNI